VIIPVDFRESANFAFPPPRLQETKFENLTKILVIGKLDIHLAPCQFIWQEEEIDGYLYLSASPPPHPAVRHRRMRGRYGLILLY
jgi:hypothetical protein